VPLIVLTLGTGLGAGLGLSGGPVTYTAGQPTSAVVQCAVSNPTPKTTEVTCASPASDRVKELANGFSTGLAISVLFPRIVEFPAGFDACMTNAMEKIWPIGSSSSSNDPAASIVRTISSCGAHPGARHVLIVT
jgi:hypothetical protein